MKFEKHIAYLNYIYKCKLMEIIKLLFLLVIGSFYSGPEVDKLNYIEQYKDLAIVEMHRTGIPASITLAQALHESNAGKSPLALEANNHFGIKCKSYWKGETYFHKDDDLNDRGQLIESCFRSYSTAVESYVDHSNFLTQSKHYSPLFSLDKDDFVAWAWGLKQCGYATDPNYAVKLIKIINRYNLTQYDNATNPWEKFSGKVRN
jgi:flagellum-specific peptidoglycan hydrolase FlgJ